MPPDRGKATYDNTKHTYLMSDRNTEPDVPHDGGSLRDKVSVIYVVFRAGVGYTWCAQCASVKRRQSLIK